MVLKNIKDFDRYLFSKKVVLATVIALLFLGFKDSVENWYNEHIVNSLSLFKPDRLFDILYGFIIVGAVCYLVFKLRRKYLPSSSFVVVSAIVVVVYTYYRFVSTNWYYYPVVGNVAYADILYFFFTIVLGLYIYSILTSGKINTVDDVGFYLDEPLKDDDVDLLGREDVAKHLAHKICSTSLNSSFAVGIVGKWGTGKTSFMRLVERNLEDGCIIFQFNPWSSSNTGALINDFFAELSNQLSLYDGQIAGNIRSYTKLLKEVGTSWGKVVDVVSNTFVEDSLVAKKKIIDDIIDRTGRKIVVFIDDLDRLDQKEVIEVIRLIRNTANFKNTVFVVAYDRGYVIDALQNITEYSSEMFLEKIFQFELNLPQFEPNRITQMLLKRLEGKVSDEHFTELKDAIQHRVFDRTTYVQKYLLNLRDISRFLNGFIFSYELLHGEIVLNDLINIECIRLKYPSVYTLIFDRRSSFFATNTNGYEFNQHYFLKRESHGSESDLSKFIKGNCKSYNISTEDVDDLVGAIDKLFPQHKSWSVKENARLSICHPNGFSRYFANRLFAGELSENEFVKYRNLDSQTLNKQVELWVNQGLRNEVIKKIESISLYTNKDDFEKLIVALFHCVNIPKVEEINSDYQSYNDVTIYYKIQDDAGEISKKYYVGDKDSYKSFLLKVFTSVEEPYTENYLGRNLAGWILSSGNKIVISDDELIQMNLVHLRKHIDLLGGRFAQFNWRYLLDCKKLNVVETEDKKIEKSYYYDKAVRDVMINFIANDYDGFLIRILQQTRPEGEFYEVSDIVKSIYGSYESFESILSNLNEDRFKYVREFKAFYGEFKKAGYKPVNFEFKNIEVNTWR